MMSYYMTWYNSPLAVITGNARVKHYTVKYVTEYRYAGYM